MKVSYHNVKFNVVVAVVLGVIFVAPGILWKSLIS